MSYVDLHIHGAFGIDLVHASEAQLDRLALGLEAHGYASFLPTLIPLPQEQLEATVATLSAWIAKRHFADQRGAMPLGIHFEGPFISKSRSGALHPDCFLDANDSKRVQRFMELVQGAPGDHMVTLAPEIPGGIELVRELSRLNVLVSMGHTDADYDVLEKAFHNGARHMTHFCNAMRPVHHRSAGPIEFGLLNEEISLDLIADSHHLSNHTLRLILKCRRPDRLALISDAAPPAGLGDGEYEVWGETLIVRDGRCQNTQGALAGSVSLLDRGVKTLVEAGLNQQRAVDCATTVPLKILRGH